LSSNIQPMLILTHELYFQLRSFSNIINSCLHLTHKAPILNSYQLLIMIIIVIYEDYVKNKDRDYFTKKIRLKGDLLEFALNFLPYFDSTTIII